MILLPPFITGTIGENGCMIDELTMTYGNGHFVLQSRRSLSRCGPMFPSARKYYYQKMRRTTFICCYYCFYWLWLISYREFRNVIDALKRIQYIWHGSHCLMSWKCFCGRKICDVWQPWAQWWVNSPSITVNHRRAVLSVTNIWFIMVDNIQRMNKRVPYSFAWKILRSTMFSQW